MTIIQLILTAILLTTVFLSFRKGTDLFSPARVFILVWTVSIILAEFKFSGFQHIWSWFSWFVLISGLVSFLLGIYISYALNAGKPLIPVKLLRTKFTEERKDNYDILFYTNVILFTLYIISYVLEVMIIGNVPIFSKRIDEARTEFGVFGLHLMVNFQLVIMFLNIEYIILSRKVRTKRIINIFIFVITLITFTLLLQRFNYFMWGIMTLTFLYYSSQKLRPRNILIISLIFFAFLYFIQSIRISQYVEAFVYVISKMKYPREYAMFTEPYMYIAMNLENMARAVDKLEYFTWGSLTGDWLLALSGIKTWVLDYFNVNARPFLISGFNTFPFLWNYYSDFGVLGTFIFPLVTGFLISTVYYSMRITGELRWIVFYSLSMVLIFISFFTNPLTMLNIWVAGFLLWFIHRFLIKSPRKASI